MNNWKECKLGDIINIIGGGTPKTSVPEYWDGDIPWLSVTDFNNGRKYCFDAEKKITEKGLNESSTKILKKGQIIISARGTVGVISVLGRDMAFNQSNYGIDAKIESTTNEFLYYLLKYNIPNFLSNSYGAVFDTITKETFNQIDILLPPLPEQKAIADVLSSLDDKIDLLHRQNKTLEAKAETLFRKWFVEEENNDTISQFVYIQNGFAFKSQDFIPSGSEHIIKIKNISNGIVDIDNTDYVANNVIDKISDCYKIYSGDILIAMTGAEIGKLGLIPYTNKSLWLNQRVGLLKEKYLGAKYLAYLQLKSEFGQDYIENSATGSAQPNISSSALENCGFPKLNEEEIIKYSRHLSFYYDKIVFNLGQIRTLEKLRDTLLPKLMSGEVRVNI